MSISGRLEHVRSATGSPSVKDFYQRVYAGELAPPNYRTVTNYHNGSREPSVTYLVRVCDVFRVRSDFLLRGSLPVFEADEPQWQEETEALTTEASWHQARIEAFWQEAGLLELPLHLKHQFLGVWADFNNLGWFSSAARNRLDPQVGHRLHGILMYPFGRLAEGIEVSSRPFADYAVVMLLAIQLALKIELYSSLGGTED